MKQCTSRQPCGDAQIGAVAKNLAANEGHACSIPGPGRSPGEGNGNPLQYSCLRIPVDRGAWWVTVHGVTKSQTWMSNWARTCTHAHTHTHTHTKSLPNNRQLNRKTGGLTETHGKANTNQHKILDSRDGMGREVGGGFRMGNTCTPLVDACWCMAKPIQYFKVKKIIVIDSVKYTVLLYVPYKVTNSILSFLV